MKNIRPKHLFVSLLAVFLLASFTRPLKKVESNFIANNTLDVRNIKLFSDQKSGTSLFQQPTFSITESSAQPPTATDIVNSNFVSNVAQVFDAKVEPVPNKVIEPITSLPIKPSPINIPEIVSNKDSVSKTAQVFETLAERLFNEVIAPISPLPVKPLPISISKKLIDFKHILWLNEDNLFKKEYYRYDSTAHNFKKIDNIKTIAGFDPVRFRLNISKDSVAVGEEFELKITAEFLDVSPHLIFQFEGSNGFTLKMLLPDNFVQTGGTYYDFIQGKVTRQIPRQEFTIKGYFEAKPKLSDFVLLRSFTGATITDVYEKKAEILVPIYRSEIVTKKQIVQDKSKETLSDLINKDSTQIKNFILDCPEQIPPPQTSSGGQYCTSNIIIYADCISSSYSVRWTDDVTGSPRTINTTMYNLGAKCIDTSTGCESEYGGHKDYIKVTPSGPPVISVQNGVNTICSGTYTTLYASNCSGDVKWYKDNVAITSHNSAWQIIDLGPGVYKAKCKVEICESGFSNELTISYRPTPPTPSRISGNNLVCSSNNTTILTAEGCSGGVRWLDAISEIGVTEGNTYQATVGTYYAACHDATCNINGNYTSGFQVSQRLPLTQVNAGADQRVCGSATVNLNGTHSGCSGGNVQWQYLNGQPLNPFSVPPGTYKIFCWNECSNNSDEVTIFSDPVVPSVTITGVSDVCGLNTVNLGYSGCSGGNVSWLKNGNPITNGNNATAGTYTVICTLNNLCSNTSDTKTINNTGPCFDFSVSYSRQSCNNNIILSSSGCPSGGTIDWSTNYNFTAIFSHSVTEHYQVISPVTIWGRCTSGVNSEIEEVGTFYPYPGITTPSLSNLTANPGVEVTDLGGGFKRVRACIGHSLNIGGVYCSSGEEVIWHNSLPSNMPDSPDVIYYATCRNTSNGCEGGSSPYLQLVPIIASVPTISASASSICVGQSTTLTAAACNAGGSLRWSPTNETSQSINVSPTTTTAYVATCTYVSCIQSDSKTIQVNQLPTTIATNQTACEGSTVALSKNQHLSNENYVWKNASGTVIPDGIIYGFTTSNAGTYTLIATSSEGCSKTTTSQLNINYKPVINASVDCATITIASLNSNIDRVYISGPVSQNSTLTLQSGFYVTNFTNLPPGDYTIFANSTAGCQSDFTNKIVGPAPATISFNGDATASSKVVCNGTSLTLDLTTACPSNYTPQWVDNINEPFPRTINFNEISSITSTYQVKCVGSSGGCTLYSLSNTLSVTVNYVTPPTVSTLTLNACGTGTVDLGGSCSGSTIQWYKVLPPSTTLIAVNQILVPDTNPNTEYYAKCFKTITGITCPSIKSVAPVKVNINPVPVATLTCTNCIPPTNTSNNCPANDGTPKVGNSLVLTSTCTVGNPTWISPNPLRPINATTASVTITNVTIADAGVYQVICTTAQGCTSTATKPIVIYPNCGLSFKDVPTVAKNCTTGVFSISAIVCNRTTATRKLQYQLEVKNADNTYTIIIPFRDATEDANNAFTTQDVTIEGTYRLSIQEIPRSNEGDQTICRPSPSGDIDVTCPCVADGQNIKLERWDGIGGSSVLSLTSNPAFLQTPTDIKNLHNFTTKFEGESNIGDSYGARIRAFICPPTNGTYYFYIAGDDQVELWLSPDANPATKQLIASHTGWTGSYEYTKFPSQKSVAIQLIANKKYYIEALMKEDIGGDNFSVGWTTPGTNTIVTVPISVLSEFKGCYLTASASKTSIFANEAVTLTASGGPSNANYVWKLNGTQIGTGSSITVSPSVNSTYLLTCTNCTTTNSRCLDGSVSINVLPALNGCVKITALHSGKSLYIDNANNGAAIKQGTYSGLDTQIWQVESIGGNIYKIHSAKNSKVIESENSVVRLYDLRTAYNQSWQLSFVAGNIYQIINPVDGNVFDVSGISMNDGATIQLHPNLNSDNQKFRIESVTCPTFEPANCVVDNQITYERWDNIAGYRIEDLTGHYNYTQAPSSALYINANTNNPVGLNIRNDATQNFGARIRGYICPPFSGTRLYTFYLTSDNSARMWLSTDDLPQNKVQRADKTDNGDPNDGAQHDIPVTFTAVLTGGQKYYFEILHKQWISTSFVKLEWESNGLARQVITGNNLSKYAITIPPQDPPTCFFELKGADGTDLPTSIALGDYFKAQGVSATNTFVWKVSTGGNDYYTAIPTPSSTGLSTTEVNPVYIKPGSLGEKIYRVELKNQPSCYREIKVTVKDVDCNCESALTDTRWQTVKVQADADFNGGDRNYVVTNNYLAETSTRTGTTEIGQTIIYYDGIGRPIQTINTGSSTSGKDIVVPYEYDNLGRAVKDYLPFSQGTGGTFKSDVINSQKSFYTNLKADNNAYAESVLENSPLDRLIKQGKEGTTWQPNTDRTQLLNDKTIKFDFRHNTETDIIRFTYQYNSTTSVWEWKIDKYPVNTLFVSETYDEKNVKVTEYIDVAGNIVCKKIDTDTATPLITYNAFDTFGKLRFMIPPKAAVKVISLLGQNTSVIFNPTATNFKDEIYTHKYDKRGRLIEYKSPDAGVEEMVYNPFDQLVLYRNALHRANNIWLYTKFDELGRIKETGTYANNSTRLDAQAAVNTYYSGTYAYGTAGYPTSGTTPQQTSFYDSYSGLSRNSTVPVGGEFTLATAIPSSNITLTGKLTGTIETVVKPEATAPNLAKSALETVYFYDKYGQIIQTRADNHLGNEDVGSLLYDFSGKILETKASTLAYGQEPQKVWTETTYDVGGRTKMIVQRINNGKKQPVGRYTYNEIGELTEKIMGCDQQTVTYETNIRGWLTKINGSANPTTLKANKKFFGYELTYNDDGKIKIQQWGTVANLRAGVVLPAQRSYTYEYYKTGMLKKADYAGGANENFSLSDMEYDDNGNIKKMKRMANTDIEDLLTYSYDANSNQLLNVTDTGIKTRADTHIRKHYFQDRNDNTTSGQNDYEYDVAGNLTVDRNRNISITYNYLNLPAKVTHTTTNTVIYYYYTASGVKIRKTNAGVKDSDGIAMKKVKMDYVAGIVYIDEKLEEIPTAEGRALPGLVGNGFNDEKNFRYEYQYNDHLGNLRVACRCGEKIDANNKIVPTLLTEDPRTVMQENHYDPWGLNLTDIEPKPKPEHLWQFNGGSEKAYLPDGSFDFETAFRMYDPQIGRFKGVDMLASSTSVVSTYQFAFNDPINYFDPLGLQSAPVATPRYAVPKDEARKKGVGKASNPNAQGLNKGLNMGLNMGLSAANSYVKGVNNQIVNKATQQAKGVGVPNIFEVPPPIKTTPLPEVKPTPGPPKPPSIFIRAITTVGRFMASSVGRAAMVFTLVLSPANYADRRPKQEIPNPTKYKEVEDNEIIYRMMILDEFGQFKTSPLDGTDNASEKGVRTDAGQDRRVALEHEKGNTNYKKGKTDVDVIRGTVAQWRYNYDDEIWEWQGLSGSTVPHPNPGKRVNGYLRKKDFPAGVTVIRDGPTHYSITPARQMKIEEYITILNGIKWNQLPKTN